MMINIDGHSVYVRPNFKPKKNWAVFLDRDGAINQETHLLHKIKDFQLIPQTSAAVKKLNQQNIPAFVIHNAAVVCRGICSLQQVEKIGQHLIKQLAKDNVYIDAIFFCPHHKQAFNKDFIKDCDWRKPGSGMLKAAAKQFNLDLSKSFVIGDTPRDILAGQAVKATSILVNTGHAGKDKIYQAKPDKISTNILTAVNWILKQ